MTGARPNPGAIWRLPLQSLWWLTPLLLLVTGCATTAPAEPGTGADIGRPVVQTASRMADVATTPLHDLNLVRDEIPEVLLTARAQPYAAPANPACEALALELATLDAALGPDLDAPVADAASASLISQGAAAAGDAAVQMVRASTESLIPLRDWVRRFSGAQQHSRDRADAMAAGSFRRAFLRGYAQALACPRGD